MSPRHRRRIKSAVESIYEEMRDEIVHGRLAPAMPLVLAELADQFGVSTMPIRGALQRLEAEGYVIQFRARGATVAPLSLDDLEDIQAIRSGIEGFAARLGAESMSKDDIRRMEALLERTRGEAGAMRSIDGFIAFQWRFHGICYAAARRDRLSELIEDHQRRAERYIRLAMGDQGGFEASLEYQERFLDSCRRHDGAGAEHTIREALTWTVTRLGPLIPVAAGAGDEAKGRAG